MSWLGSKSVQYCLSEAYLFFVFPDKRFKRRFDLEVAKLLEVDLLEEGMLHYLLDAVFSKSLCRLGELGIRFGLAAWRRDLEKTRRSGAGRGTCPVESKLLL